MAKSVLEVAVLDAQLQLSGESFGGHLGASRDRVPCGVSVGIMDSIPELLDVAEGYVAEGYVRIKLKIEPGWDVEPVRAVRERFGDSLLLQVDADAACTLVDAQQLAKLDDFGLLLIEQPKRRGPHPMDEAHHPRSVPIGPCRSPESSSRWAARGRCRSP